MKTINYILLSLALMMPFCASSMNKENSESKRADETQQTRRRGLTVNTALTPEDIIVQNFNTLGRDSKRTTAKACIESMSPRSQLDMVKAAFDFILNKTLAQNALHNPTSAETAIEVQAKAATVVANSLRAQFFAKDDRKSTEDTGNKPAQKKTSPSTSFSYMQETSETPRITRRKASTPTASTPRNTEKKQTPRTSDDLDLGALKAQALAKLSNPDLRNSSEEEIRQYFEKNSKRGSVYTQTPTNWRPERAGSIIMPEVTSLIKAEETDKFDEKPNKTKKTSKGKERPGQLHFTRNKRTSTSTDSEPNSGIPTAEANAQQRSSFSVVRSRGSSVDMNTPLSTIDSPSSDSSSIASVVSMNSVVTEGV